ncbi:MAG: NUDIX domain-containing protein [Dissulfuribacterales bacterium]
MSDTNELVAIVNDKNEVVEALPRAEMRQKRLPHRAVYILVLNHKHELFVQKRTDTKDIYPGHFDIAAGGVVLSGESWEQAAKRELLEELGIRADLTPLFEFHHVTENNDVWGMSYLCLHEGPFVLQAEEVAEGGFMKLQDIWEMARQHPFTLDGLALFQLFMHHYTNQKINALKS